MNNNFALLQSRWPQLAEFAQYAELYVFSDPQSSLIKLRCYCESMVGLLYRELELKCEVNSSLHDKLKASVFTNVVNTDVCNKLHALRMKGNRAVHHNEASSENAVWLIKEAYLLGQWFYKTLTGDYSNAYPDFQPPICSTTSASTDTYTLEQRAERLKEELRAVEASEKKALEDLSRLQTALNEAKSTAFRNSSDAATQTIDFDSKTTLQNMSIHDAFAEYNLTEGQSELVKELDEFLSNKSQKVFQLKGYAGTGKTFITKGITEFLKSVGRTFVLAAPTGKAAKVISSKTNCEAYTLHKTIYSFKDIVEYKDESNGSETYKFYADLRVNELSADTVFIVDEASMVSDVYQESEFFRCGSGKLLSDFLKFVNLDQNDHNKKVIFIGDDAQLPPVGMSHSPALSKEHLKERFQLDTQCFELTEVVRQKADSGVMKNSIELRNTLNKGVFNTIYLDCNVSDIEEIAYEDFMPKYLASCNGGINAESIVIASSNRDVLEYNLRIRQHFFPNSTAVTAGDKVMAVANSDHYGFFISNGEFGLIRSVSPNIEERKVVLNPQVLDKRVEVMLRFRDVVVSFRDIEGCTQTFNAKIIEDLLYSDKPQLSSDQNKALYIDFCMRHPLLARKSTEFKETLRSDPYFGALRVKFGYAITCHKAQGSEWNHVFVKCKTHENQRTSGYVRWLYTAITRTANQLYVFEAPKLKPYSVIQTSSGVGGIIKPNVKIITAPIPELNEAVEITAVSPGSSNIEKNYGIPENEHFLLSILSQVRNLVDGSGITLRDIDHKLFQEIYIFQCNNESIRVNIWYKKTGKISNISTPDTTNWSSALIGKLQALKVGEVSNLKNQEQGGFSQEFQNEFHIHLSKVMASAEIEIVSVKEHAWSLRYTFKRAGSHAVIDVYFDKKQCFTKINVLNNQCVGPELVAEVEELLTTGLDK
ncbi:ATP-dependent DNA helicase [Aliivibrio fischeri]|uniref:AAA family ATPase n=1 Tax=Aliivibrio fischeri TaxID=668 RepID=A0A844P4E0_ALIFS|nr:AAA family ATPase [Aliivibrio fischeri]MUK50036.1 AAA family ATPase [Aliivibrio fischeri]MUK64468.1 AAA family ATPase [Aliivibrio fischeri]